MSAVVAAAALVAAAANRPHVFPQVPPEDEPTILANVGSWKAASAGKTRRLLVVSSEHAAEWHAEAVSYALRSLACACVKGNWRFDVADFSVLAETDLLKRYDAIVLNNCTCAKVSPFPAMEGNIREFVAGGKGIVLIHSALDAFHDSPSLQRMFGGAYWGHPWTVCGEKWGILNESPDHPLNACFGGQRKLKFEDELYQHLSPQYDRSSVRVLLSVDLADAASSAALARYERRNGSGKVRADRDFAVSWCRDVGRGRVFYTTFGHDRKAFLDPLRLHHILDGVRYALGDFAAIDVRKGEGI